MLGTLLCLAGLVGPQFSEAAVYTVKKGDTLWRISRQFRTTVGRLQEINGIKGTPIYPGQLLLISSAEAPTKPVPVASYGEKNIYSGRGNGQGIIATARRFMGVPYRYGGVRPETGFDCSGFVQYVFSFQGIQLPRTAGEQARAGTRVNDALPGDLVFFDTNHNGFIGHVGIYVGNGAFIHASTKRGITITSLTEPWYRQRYAFTCRIL